jgi:hypothetical protein
MDSPPHAHGEPESCSLDSLYVTHLILSRQRKGLITSEGRAVTLKPSARSEGSTRGSLKIADASGRIVGGTTASAARSFISAPRCRRDDSRTHQSQKTCGAREPGREQGAQGLWRRGWQEGGGGESGKHSRAELEKEKEGRGVGWSWPGAHTTRARNVCAAPRGTNSLPIGYPPEQADADMRPCARTQIYVGLGGCTVGSKSSASRTAAPSKMAALAAPSKTWVTTDANGQVAPRDGAAGRGFDGAF